MCWPGQRARASVLHSRRGNDSSTPLRAPPTRLFLRRSLAQFSRIGLWESRGALAFDFARIRARELLLPATVFAYEKRAPAALSGVCRAGIKFLPRRRRELGVPLINRIDSRRERRARKSSSRPRDLPTSVLAIALFRGKKSTREKERERKKER